MSYQHLLLSIDVPISTVTLNRPDKRNALAMPMLLELTRAFHEVTQTLVASFLRPMARCSARVTVLAT